MRASSKRLRCGTPAPNLRTQNILAKAHQPAYRGHSPRMVYWKGEAGKSLSFHRNILNLSNASPDAVRIDDLQAATARFILRMAHKLGARTRLNEPHEKS